MLRSMPIWISISGLLLAAGLATPCPAQEPVVVRVAFWVPAARHAEFAEDFDTHIWPLLRARGFRPSKVQGRQVVDGVYARMLETDAPRTIWDTMMAMMKSIQAFAARFGNAGMFVDDMPDGFPIHVRHLDTNGQVTSEQEVTNVSQQSLDQSLFEVPSGYERKEMPSLPQ